MKECKRWRPRSAWQVMDIFIFSTAIFLALITVVDRIRAPKLDPSPPQTPCARVSTCGPSTLANLPDRDKCPVQGINLEPIGPNRLTGPREGPVPHRRGLIVIVATHISAENVNKLIPSFLSESFKIFLVHADDKVNFADQPWKDQVFRWYFTGEHKWWYIKQFVMIETVDNFDFVLVIDEFVDPESSAIINIEKVLDLMSSNNIQIAQPALQGSKGTWSVVNAPSETPANPGRKTNFVSASPLTIFSKSVYQKCVWDLIQYDIITGDGLEIAWSTLCPSRTSSSLAVIDRYPAKIIEQYRTPDNITDDARLKYSAIYLDRFQIKAVDGSSFRSTGILDDVNTNVKR